MRQPPPNMLWAKLVALFAVLSLVGGLGYLGSRIEPKDSNNDG